MENGKNSTRKIELLKRLERELEYRVRHLRPKIINELRSAISQRDLSENSEYEAARAAQSENEFRIRQLEMLVNRTSDSGGEAGVVSFDFLLEVLEKDRPSPYKLKLRVAGYSESS